MLEKCPKKKRTHTVLDFKKEPIAKGHYFPTEQKLWTPGTTQNDSIDSFRLVGPTLPNKEKKTKSC